MGLGVYLNWYCDFEDAQRRRKAFEERNEAFWSEAGGYDKATPEQKAEIEARSLALSAELGLVGRWGDLPEGEERAIRLDAPGFEDHLFKIGYMRSSYNEGGINRVLANMAGLPDGLYGIFGLTGAENEDPELRPDWAAAKARAAAAREALEAVYRTEGELRAFWIGPNVFFSDEQVAGVVAGGPSSVEAAISAVRAAVLGREPGSSWSTRAGDFSTGGAEFMGALLGSNGLDRSLRPGAPRPGAWIVTRISKPAGAEGAFDESQRFYLDALTIVGLMCDWVLEQPDPENYVLHWSG